MLSSAAAASINDEAGSTDRNAGTHTLRFQRPSSSAARGGRDKIFPPTVFTDAKYTRGVLVPNASSAAVASASNDLAVAGLGDASRECDLALAPRSIEDVAIQIPNDYFCQDRRAGGGQVPQLPRLSPNEAARWIDKHAAHAAARRRSPMNAVRLLGTITLLFEEKGGKPSSKGSLFDQAKKHSDKYKKRYVEKDGLQRQPAAQHNKFARNLSKKQAIAEACSEMGLGEDIDVSSLSREVQVQVNRLSQQITEYWKGIKESPPLRECWNQKDGGFVREVIECPSLNDATKGNQEEQYIPIACLLDWMKSDRIKDLYAGRLKSLYDGLRHIPTDAKSILESLMDLSCPKFLYKIPLISPYAVARRMVQNENGGSIIKWEVRIGVYMNRLLPEVLIEKALHCVMSALDADSFIVSEPLHMPPMRNRNNPVFESSKYPIVKMPGECKEASEVIVIDDDDEEEKKEDDGMQLDPAMMGSTRDSKTISPFTPKGLLKLLELRSGIGNDISMFPALARSLSPYLKLDLMLHQRHALCWMNQMEQLPGFGINSIIWEERMFLDGGKYYYSPALGQIRLNRPPATVGGCVADEMGLGKTLQMLSLIASTLDSIKQEVATQGGKYSTHATLIIVPPALVMQWCSEIKKSCGEALTVDVLDANSDTFDHIHVKSAGQGSDILVTTYSALEKPQTSRYLGKWSWTRVVLDEQQEIRSSTTKIATNCESLDCHRRWMLSGTPIFEGIDDLRGELNFLRLVPYAAKHEDGFFDFSVMNHWKVHSEHGLETLRILGLLILRRSKDMKICKTGQSIMEQRKLTVELVPVAQSDSERALYCWFEYLVSQELQRKDESSADTKKNLQSRALCLRLLREICFSAVMINGGLGVTSQMKILNKLYRSLLARVEQQHQQADRRKTKRKEAIRVLSPLEALRYLSQVERAANVGDEFVSEQQFSRGQGATSRARAAEDIGLQVKRAQELVDEANRKATAARRKRAKAYWHLALELISTGALCDNSEFISRVSPKISLLWKRRCLCIERGNAESGNVAPCLLRGWRPHPSFAKNLLSSNPGFHWARPGCLLLQGIPAQVSLTDIAFAIFQVSKKEPQARSKLETLRKNLGKVNSPSQSDITDAEKNLSEAISYDQQLQQPTLFEITNNNPDSPTTMAYLHVSNEEELIRYAQSRLGVPLKCSKVIPAIQTALEKANQGYSQAEAEYNVHPCEANKKKKAEARKALDTSKLGLTINYGSPPFASTMSIIMSRAVRSFRGTGPQSKSGLVDGSLTAIAQATDTLERSLSRLQHGQSTLARLMPAMNRGVPQDIAQKSAFDTLESLRRNAFEETFCAICQMPFGENAGDDPNVEAKIVAMISCGHFYCIKCLDHHAHSEISKNKALTCPNCRSGFNQSSDVMHIDHTANDDEEDNTKRTEAKAKVLEAAESLATSEGVLDAELWHALFLSIDLPTHVSNAPHHLHTALHGNVLAHFRAATGMNVDCARSGEPKSWSTDESLQHFAAGLSSKIQALLGDLPLGEHAVVFSSSKEGVLHLATVMKAKGIECFSLYTGQKTKGTEEAVSSWVSANGDSSKAGPVLVVQAGAAASGLTLTAASKMFLMEPFSRQEEEQQAYARCHRYGQKNDVEVKIYYAPVSVESRLLHWRRRSVEKMAANGNNTHYVFSKLFDGEEEDSGVEDNGYDEHFGNVGGIENDEQSNHDEKNKSSGEEEDLVEVGEDNLRTQFLLGLVDEHGNPTDQAEADDQNNENHLDAASNTMSARRFVLD